MDGTILKKKINAYTQEKIKQTGISKDYLEFYIYLQELIDDLEDYGESYVEVPTIYMDESIACANKRAATCATDKEYKEDEEYDKPSLMEVLDAIGYLWDGWSQEVKNEVVKNILSYYVEEWRVITDTINQGSNKDNCCERKVNCCDLGKDCCEEGKICHTEQSDCCEGIYRKIDHSEQKEVGAKKTCAKLEHLWSKDLHSQNCSDRRVVHTCSGTGGNCCGHKGN